MDYSVLNKISNSYGDSFYLLDTEKFKDNYTELLNSFKKYYKNTNIGYSYKTNYTPVLCKLIDDNGGFAEVVSDMEYSLAIAIGVAPQNIIVNGPYKTKKLIEKYVLNKSIVNLDSYREFEYIKEIAIDNPSVNIEYGIRCNFSIGNNNISRFGVDTENSDFVKKISELNKIPNVLLSGIHCHFPDRNADSYVIRAEKIIKLVKLLFKTPPRYIDIGGGYFGKMDQSLRKQFSSYHDYDEYAEKIGRVFYKEYGELPNKSQPLLILEPGSAIVADVVKFVCKIVEIKNIRNSDIAICTGSKFNIGLLSSTINSPISVFSKNETGTYHNSIDISGYTCIESDYLYRGYQGNLDIDDFIMLDNAGSYSIVFKPPFILPNVPVVEIKNNKINVIKRQETFNDVFSTFSW
ncbi:decarboxylase [Morganella morganii]